MSINIQFYKHSNSIESAMTHTGTAGVLSDLKNVLKISTVEFETDHFLQDYTPYVSIIKIGGLNPEEVKNLIKRGMIILSTRCNDCPCKYRDENNKEIGGVQEIAVTPIDKTVENRNLTKWVEEVKEALKASMN